MICAPSKTRVVLAKLVALALLAGGGNGAAARADVVSTFDTGAEGWTLANGAGSLTWNAMLGNPDGGISGADTVGGRLWYFAAPAAFLGDQSAALGGSVTWDRRNIAGGSAVTDVADVILESATRRIGYSIPGNVDLPTWQTFSVPLTHTGWFDTGNFPGTPAGGDPVTQEEFEAVLSSLIGLYIQGEYRNGNDIGALDNVILSVPCPADYDNSGSVTSDDFFAFIVAFFAGTADFNQDGLTTSQDFFDFITAFFAGC